MLSSDGVASLGPRGDRTPAEGAEGISHEGVRVAERTPAEGTGTEGIIRLGGGGCIPTGPPRAPMTCVGDL